MRCPYMYQFVQPEIVVFGGFVRDIIVGQIPNDVDIHLKVCKRYSISFYCLKVAIWPVIKISLETIWKVMDLNITVPDGQIQVMITMVYLN